MNTQNLKPFNLERALAGDPVVTRNGRKVTQLTSFNVPGLSLVGVTEGLPDVYKWLSSGAFLCNDDDHYCDLFMAPIEKSGWIKIYPESMGSIIAHAYCVFDTEEEATLQSFPGLEKGIVTRISWTE